MIRYRLWEPPSNPQLGTPKTNHMPNQNEKKRVKEGEETYRVLFVSRRKETWKKVTPSEIDDKPWDPVLGADGKAIVIDTIPNNPAVAAAFEKIATAVVDGESQERKGDRDENGDLIVPDMEVTVNFNPETKEYVVRATFMDQSNYDYNPVDLPEAGSWHQNNLYDYFSQLAMPPPPEPNKPRAKRRRTRA